MDLNSFPEFARCDEQTSRMDGGPFPVYLQNSRLFLKAAATPQNQNPSMENSKIAWRASLWFIDGSETSKVLAAMESQRKDRIISESTKLQQEVEDWIARLPKQKNTIIVINDRNALKEQDESTSVRATLMQIAMRMANIPTPSDGQSLPLTGDDYILHLKQ